MSWYFVAQIAFLTVLVVLLIAFLMVLRDRLVSKRRYELIHQVQREITQEYLPMAEKMTIEMTNELMDRVSEKMMDVAKECMKLTQIDN